MSNETNVVCPRCGSADTKRRPGLFAAGRVCRACRKRFTPPSPKAGGIVVAIVFIVAGLAFSIIAVMASRIFLEIEPAKRSNTWDGLLCSGILAIPALVCFALAVRELLGRKKTPQTEPHQDDGDLLEEPYRMRP